MSDPFVDASVVGDVEMDAVETPVERAADSSRGDGSRAEAEREEPKRDRATMTAPETAKEQTREAAPGRAVIRPIEPRPSPANGQAEAGTQTRTSARHVCPFCGSQNTTATGPCPRCTMEDTLATREATKGRIGPWFVLQARNPAAPGMKYATLLALVGKGQVTARSIVRGPTTYQLWRFAAQVRGLSREFGACYSCGQPVEKTASYCQSCERPQVSRGDPDELLEGRDSMSAVPGPLGLAGGAMGVGSTTLPALSQRSRDVEMPAFSAPGLRPARRHSVVPIVPGRTPAGVVSARDLAAALQENGPEPKERRPWVRRAMLLVLIMAAAGAAVLAWLEPDLWQQGRQWVATTYDAARQRVDAALASRTHTSAAAPAVPQSSTTTNDLPVAPPEVAPVREVPAPSLAAHQADESATGRPNGMPAVVVAPDVAPTPAPQPVAKPQQPVAGLGTTALASAGNAAAPGDLDRSRKLYDRAIDSESHNDWAQAVRYYEAIQKLPRSAWEADLMPRLTYARKMAGQ